MNGVTAADLRPERVLEAPELRRAFAVLEEAETASGVDRFREAVLEALSRHFGFTTTTFFTGPTLAGMFLDRRPLANGLAARMVPAYVERFHLDDPFAQPAFINRYRPGMPLHLRRLHGVLPRTQHHYVQDFLVRHDIQDKIVIPLFTGQAGAVAGIGLLSQTLFTTRDEAVTALLSRHLGRLFTLQLRAATVPDPPARLSRRQAEVTSLVARGLSNQEISRTLSVSVDTVKKHLTAALRATDCARRTQLAVYWNRHTQRPPG